MKNQAIFSYQLNRFSFIDLLTYMNIALLDPRKYNRFAKLNNTPLEKERKTMNKTNIKYPRCPKCGKGTSLHHSYKYYNRYKCTNKKCNHIIVKHNS